jgi:Bacterial extracellular solute-binding proteins, family 5 Middle
MKFSLPKFNHELFQPQNINFSILGKPKVINKALKKATPLTRTLVILEFGILIAAIITTFFGVYLVATKDIPDPNSEINEAVVLNFNHLNPIYTPKNSVEDRVTKMLYTPLYHIDYDEIGTKSNAKVTTSSLIEKYNWDSEKPEQKIVFKLKNNLTFNDGSILTSSDVKYTFDKIKELATGNKKYKKSFDDLTLNIINELEYEVVSAKARSSMIYDLDFSPVSKAYMEVVPSANLYDSEQTKTPFVTSGFFKISTKQVQDKDYSEKKQVPNPIIINEATQYLKLDRFISKNNVGGAAVNSWNIKKYDSILATNLAQGKSSIEADSKIGKVDLFIRQYSENPINPDRPEDIKKALISLNKQDHVNSDWYMNGYFNPRSEVSRTKPATKQVFRNYTSCILIKNNFPSYYYSQLNNQKRSFPIQLNSKLSQNCAENLPEDQYIQDAEGYLSFKSADPGLNFKILYLGYDNDLEKYLVDTLQTKSKIRTEVISLNSNAEELKKSFASADQLARYDLIIYPTQINNLKLNQEVLKTNSNLLGFGDEVTKIEELNTKFVNGGLTTENSDEIAKFFTEKSLLVNLYNYKTEVNHNFRKPILISKTGEINYEFTGWYNKTVKDWFFK